MEYKARYVHPFTIEQVVQLDVPVIIAEIARLQNSLIRLRDTQQQLQEIIDKESEPDSVIIQAFEENKVVISSQEERISILRLALEEKGLVGHSNPHYDPPRSSREEQSPAQPEDSVAEGVFL